MICTPSAMRCGGSIGCVTMSWECACRCYSKHTSIDYCIFLLYLSYWWVMMKGERQDNKSTNNISIHNDNTNYISWINICCCVLTASACSFIFNEHSTKCNGQHHATIFTWQPFFWCVLLLMWCLSIYNIVGKALAAEVIRTKLNDRWACNGNIVLIYSNIVFFFFRVVFNARCHWILLINR